MCLETRTLCLKNLTVICFDQNCSLVSGFALQIVMEKCLMRGFRCNITKLKRFLMSTDFAETNFYLLLLSSMCLMLHLIFLGCRQNFVC